MLPREFTERMEQILGKEYPAFLESYQQAPFQALRVNPLKGNRDDFLAKTSFHLSPVPWEPNGFYYDSKDAPGKHPYHAAGVYYIQEPSAMAPAVYLDAQPGERILDLCAAPGGKSTQIAAAMKGQGLLISNEIHSGRARILSENIERMGITNAVVLNETPEKLAEVFPAFFDRILVDAPCSGEGMFRKNEEACTQWSVDHVTMCAQRQQEILECAARMLCPGGRLVYSTCTFSPEENEGSVSAFLGKHSEFTVGRQELFPGMSCGRMDWTGSCQPGIENTIRLFPHKIRGEGHYLAVLVKDGNVPENRSSSRKTGSMKAVSEKEMEDYALFTDTYLRKEWQGERIRFGEQLYLLPAGMPSLQGLRVLRPGLHLGTFRKNRFEPAHALALAMKPDEVKNSCDLSSEGPEIYDYLRGQTFNAQGEKGWYLITVDGYSTGWGKLAGNVMKNHYPRGLRREFHG